MSASIATTIPAERLAEILAAGVTGIEIVASLSGHLELEIFTVGADGRSFVMARSSAVVTTRDEVAVEQIAWALNR